MNTVIFTICDKEYGVDISCVHEVIRMKKIIPIPDAPKFVEGVITRRGKIMPLVNIREKFKMQKEEFGRSNRIIITQVNNHFMGVVVDKIVDVISIEPGEITSPDDVLKNAEYLIGIARIGERLILITDIKKLLTDKDKGDIKKVHARVEVKKRQGEGRDGKR